MYIVIFMISMSYQCIAPLASAVPTNYTASNMHVTSVHGRPVTNTTVAMANGVPSIDFLEHEAPLLLPPSESKGWAEVDDSNPVTHRYTVLTSKAPRDDPVTGSAPCRGNCTSRTDRVSPRNHIPSPFVPPVASNGSTAERLPPIRRRVQRRVHRRHRKKGDTIKVRKLLGVYRHPTRLQSEPRGSRVTAVAVGSVVSVLLCVLAGLLPWCMCRNSATPASIDSESEEDESVLRPELLQQAAGPGRYNYCDLAAATSNFAQSKRIGRGGFGSVYCGYLDEQGRHVAVKMFSMESLDQGSMEFEHEVKIMSQLRHRNVVQLLGWCDCRKGLLLVYELVPGGSLDKRLHDPEKLLTWQERYKIALGLGSAIQYLHTECNQCVVHGDIKPSNIMLDSSDSAKLGDFGLARLVDHGAEPQTTQVIAGTVGYMDPEFVSSQKRGTESDVYSFGIVLLEIASGMRPVASGQPSVLLLRRVWDMYDRNSILDAADGRLSGDFDGHQMEHVLVTGLWCAHRHKSQRPSIEQAMVALRRCKDDFESPVVPVPLPAMHWPDSEQMRSLEEQAYGDLPTGSSSSACLSAATVYHTLEHSSHLPVLDRCCRQICL
ncbi:unnamed protein product [Triticum turgidum subsp. durum]|uniref:Protein kinase domain-containing protein n=1 Tax=Triticum turgidum subsp. durum TaxID=4567 RepID=A0A9R0X7U5_TRITD|nr:unnamed protein product [Triticum turgidum subsp. durum]